MTPTFERRSIATCIILSIVTCDIYYFYWYYCIARDLNNVDSPNRVTMSPGMVLLLHFLTCGIYTIYVFYKWGKQMPEVFGAYGRAVEDRSVLYLLLAIFLGIGPLINMGLIQNDINGLLDGTAPPLYGGQQPYGQDPAAQQAAPPPPPPPPPNSPYDNNDQ